MSSSSLGFGHIKIRGRAVAVVSSKLALVRWAMGTFIREGGIWWATAA